MQHFQDLSFLTGLLCMSSLACDPNMQPVVGILVQRLNMSHCSPSYFIVASYVKFVEMFGGRVVPIFSNQKYSYYQFLAERLNGVIFPGGDSSIYSGSYHDMATFFYNYSLEIADTKHENFAILGSCLG